jgi:aspartyl-tRNA(Asn)/glutamyl-tRNA(Gln) amidotransferase subunit A
MTAVSPKAPYELGVSEIVEGVRTGEISPVQLVRALLERISTIDQKVHAFSYLNADGALATAERLESEAKAGQIRGPLHGVPFGVKEQFAVAGVATRADWKDPSPAIAASDATCVSRIKAAGGILMGKLYMVGPSGTPPTRNSWNLEHTPGGSSSGSGAAVGARMIPFAMSEQTGGSGIRPAAYNGVSGLKPTYGRVSRYGMFPMAWSHDHACMIAQSIPDIARVFSVIAGYDAKDSTSRATPVGTIAIDSAAIRPPRIGVVRNFFPELTEPVMQDAIEAAATKLKGAGAAIVDMKLPEEFGLAWPNSMLVSGPEGAVINARENGVRAAAGKAVLAQSASGLKLKSKFSGLSRELGAVIPAAYYLQAQRIRRYLLDKLVTVFAEYDAILMATAPGPAPRGLDWSGDWSLLLPWSHLGNPAISIPCGLSPDGLPLGLQLVGDQVGDEKLLAVGAWCEAVLGRLPVPPLN